MESEKHQQPELTTNKICFQGTHTLVREKQVQISEPHDYRVVTPGQALQCWGYRKE